MKKRLISLLLAVIMVCSMIPTAFAATDEATQAAQALYELGLFKGTGTNADGTPIFDLDKTPTRNQAIIMLVRLLGKEEEAAQKVEVTAVKLKVKQSTKKYAMITVIAVIAIAVIGMIASNIHKSNLAREAAELSAEYASNMELASYTMLTGAAKAEDAGNLIKKVWYNAIYEERDSETDKYTRPKGYFVSDFNEALSTLFSDTDFQSSISSIEDSQDTVASLMKQLKSPPEEHEEAYSALKEFYDAYLELTNLATNPTGSLQTYSTSFTQADNNVLNCYNAIRLYIE